MDFLSVDNSSCSYCGPEKRESFQLCSNAEEHCVQSEAVGPPFQTTLQTADEYANILCRRYSLQYPSLLGRHGKQLPPRKGNLEFKNVKPRFQYAYF